SSLVSTLRRKLSLMDDRGADSTATADGAAAESPPRAGRTSKPRTSASKRNGRATTLESGQHTSTSRAPRSGDGAVAIAEIEGDIDRVIFKLMVVGGLERIENELRKVRRLLYHSLETES